MLDILITTEKFNIVIGVTVCRLQVYHSSIHTIEVVVRECERGSRVASEGAPSRELC